MIGVYHIVNTKTGKRYIGSSVDIEDRWKDHKWYLKKGKHHSITLQRAWDKWGEDAFLWLVYQQCNDGSKALELEQEQLNLFDTIGRWEELYNISKDAAAPTRGRKMSEEQKRKLSEANKGKVLSEEHRAKISAAQKGRPGRKMSDEEKAKRSALYKGTKRAPRSEETKRKISEKLKGNQNAKQRN